jgi:hypothetical protein
MCKPNQEGLVSLVEEAKILHGLRADLRNQVFWAKKFVADYTEHFRESSKDTSDPIKKFRYQIDSRMKQLEETVRELLQVVSL